MPVHHFSKCLLMALIVLLLMPVGPATKAGDPKLTNKIEQAIAEVRNAKSDNARGTAAQRLVEMMTGIDPKSVNLKMEAELVALLHSDDYDVRVLMTVALGQLGRKATPGDPKLNSELEQAISEVRAGKSLNERANAAERLCLSLNEIDPMYVEDKTIADMASLLDVPDDAVLMEVAGALGILGPRARAAVPKLLALLPAADCERDKAWSGITASDAMRPALRRMGVEPPPFNPKGCK